MSMVTSIPRAITNDADLALPPGPRSRVLNTMRYVSDVVGALSYWRARYGDTFTLRDLAGTTVVTCDPDLVKALFCTRGDSSFGAVVPPSFDVLLGRRSLLMLSGAEHREERRMLLGPMCRAALPEWSRAIAGATRAVFAQLVPGRQFVALERMRELTVASMSQVLFGPDDPSEPDLRRAIIEMMNRVRPSFLVTRMTQLELGGASPFGRFMAASRAL